MTNMHSLLLGFSLFIAQSGLAGTPASFSVAGDWDVRVTVDEPRSINAIVRVSPPALVTVTAEKHERVPLFNPKAGGWVKGAQLSGVKAQETTTPGLLVADSFVLRAGPEPEAALFQRG